MARARAILRRRGHADTANADCPSRLAGRLLLITHRGSRYGGHRTGGSACQSVKNRVTRSTGHDETEELVFSGSLPSPVRVRQPFEHSDVMVQVPVPSSTSRTGQAPSDQFEITVYVVDVDLRCRLAIDTPASYPSSQGRSPSTLTWKPRP